MFRTRNSCTFQLLYSALMMQKQLQSEINRQIKLGLKMSHAHELPTISARASVPCAASQHYFQPRSENPPWGAWEVPFCAPVAVLCDGSGSGACPQAQPLPWRTGPQEHWEAALGVPHLPLCWWLKWGGTSCAMSLPLTSRAVPSQLAARANSIPRE